MSYFAFHLVFTVPPILLLALLQRQPLAGIGGFKVRLALPLIALIALIYTTPWDNYLIWRDVWHYGDGRVIGTIGYVPIEEYVFFLLQPLLTGLWLYWLLAQQGPLILQERSPIVQTVGSGFWLALSLVGVWMLQSNPGVYFGLILVWAGPVLALQWVVGGSQLWARKRTWFIGTLIPTLYLWFADRFAIEHGIWRISDTYTTGLQLFGLPIEEATFFLVTNLLVVQGLLLFLLLAKTQLSPSLSKLVHKSN